MRSLVHCPICDGSGLVREADVTLADDQTLSDLDQTASDHDQTRADQDQTASDRDSDSSSEDQFAADEQLAAGGDLAAYERTTSRRARVAIERDEASALRDGAATARLVDADERDRNATLRDEEAAERDRLSTQREGDPGAGAAEMRVQAAELRLRARADRDRAAADRAAAARERLEARRAAERSRNDVVVASTDELTGVWTRRFGLAQIARELERSRRTLGALTLAFIDVDHLKLVNDREGHAAGDRLLCLVTETIQAHVRPYDIVVRHGGDEFICAMPNINRDAAAARLTAIATAVSRAATNASISFGLAEHEPGDDLNLLIGRADAELLAVRSVRVPAG